MKESDKIVMYLNIGDQRITVTVPYGRQDFVRGIEKKVDDHFRKWRLSFPNKTDREILAMVAYQYALFYGELQERYDTATAKAEECLRSIDAELSTLSPED